MTSTGNHEIASAEVCLDLARKLAELNPIPDRLVEIWATLGTGYALLAAAKSLGERT